MVQAIDQTCGSNWRQWWMERQGIRNPFRIFWELVPGETQRLGIVLIFLMISPPYGNATWADFTCGTGWPDMAIFAKPWVMAFPLAFRSELKWAMECAHPFLYRSTLLERKYWSRCGAGPLEEMKKLDLPGADGRTEAGSAAYGGMGGQKWRICNRIPPGFPCLAWLSICSSAWRAGLRPLFTRMMCPGAFLAGNGLLPQPCLIWGSGGRRNMGCFGQGVFCTFQKPVHRQLPSIYGVEEVAKSWAFQGGWFKTIGLTVFILNASF